MKAALVIIAAILCVLLVPTLMGGVDAAQTDERTDAFAAVLTAPGVTTAPVVLVTDIYSDDILNVVSITSDNALDAPLPDSYVAGTNTLTVRGLAANDTRTVTVVYAYDALTGDAASAGSFLNFLPLMFIIAIVLVVVGAIVVAFVNR